MAILTTTVAGVDRTENLCAPTAGQAAMFDEALRERKRFSCEFQSFDGSWFPARGQHIAVSHSDEGALFGGYIATATRVKQPGSPIIKTRCTCVGYEHICTRRRSIARSWTGQIAGGIFGEIVAESLTDEGFTLEYEDGPTIPYFEIQEPRPTVAEALDRLCELASSGGDHYYWDISAGKVARFYKQDTYPAPFSITAANPYILGNQGEHASVDETNQGLVNRVFVYLGQYLLDPVVEDFVGDGATRTFELAKPCGAKPTLTIDDVLVDDADIGIDGSDTGKQWYWLLGSTRIRQDDGETLLEAGNDLAVSYQGLDRRAVGPFDDSASANAEGVLQGDGTGLYETFLQIEGIGSITDAETLAQAWLDRYKTATVTFRGATFTGGLRAGQEIPINLTDLNINLTMLIQSLTMVDVGRGNFLWSFTAIFGPARDDWKRALLGKGVSASIQGEGARPGTGAVPSVTYAPNIESLSGSPVVTYTQRGALPYFYLAATINLPTAHPNYSRLRKIAGYLDGPDGIATRIPIGVIDVPALPATTVNYVSRVSPQDTAAHLYDLVVEAINEDGIATPNPFTVSDVEVAGAAGPFTPPAATVQITGVTGAETGSRTSDQFGSTSLTVRVSPVLTAGATGNIITVWLSTDGGSTWTWINWYSVTGTTPVIDIQRLAANSASTTWRVAVALGAINSAIALPSTAVQSSNFSVAGLTAPIAGGITSISFVNYPGTSDKIKYGINSVGVPTWGWYALQMTLPSVATDPYFWFARFTTQKGWAAAGVGTVSGGTTLTKTSGEDFLSSDVGKEIHVAGVRTTIAGYTSATVVTLTATLANGSGKAFEVWRPSLDYEGIERQFADSGVVTGGVAGQGQTIAFYGPGASNAWTFPPAYNLDGTANKYRKFRARVSAVSRLNDGTDTLATGWPSGADHVDLEPAMQAPSLDLGMANPNTLSPGGGVQVNPNTTRPTLASTNPTFSGVSNYGFEYSVDGQIPSNDPNWELLNLGASGSQIIRSDVGFAGLRYLRITGASYGIRDKYGIPCSGGIPVSFQIMLRSSNTSAPHSISGVLEWRDSAGGYISETSIGTASGYFASWTPGIAGIVVPPANTARAHFYLILNASETVGGYWDVDDIFLQAVVQQTANGQTATMQPTLANSDYSALYTHTGGVDNSLSVYGRRTIYIKSPNGSNFLLAVVDDTTVDIAIQKGTYGCQMSAFASQANFSVTHAGAAHAGGTFTFPDNNGVTRTVKGGLLIS